MESAMKDVQSGPDNRNMPIQKVGIRQIRYPITVRDKSREKQQTVANLTLSVNLPHNYRGTHMSRLIEVLDKFKDEVSYHTLDVILLEIKKALSAEESHIEIDFPFFQRTGLPFPAWSPSCRTTAASPPVMRGTWRYPPGWMFPCTLSARAPGRYRRSPPITRGGRSPSPSA